MLGKFSRVCDVEMSTKMSNWNGNLDGRCANFSASASGNRDRTTAASARLRTTLATAAKRRAISSSRARLLPPAGNFRPLRLPTEASTWALPSSRKSFFLTYDSILITATFFSFSSYHFQ